MAKNGFEQLSDMLFEMEGETGKAIKAGSEEAAITICNIIRNNAMSLWPGSEYPKNLTYTEDKHGYIVHNKKTYRLAHLLNNGHRIIKNGRVVGSAKAKPHIISQADAEKISLEIMYRRLNQL